MSLLLSASQGFFPLNDSPGIQNVLWFLPGLSVFRCLGSALKLNSEGLKQKISSGWRSLGLVAGIREGLRAAPPPLDSVLVVALEENRDQNTHDMLLAASHLVFSATYGH